MEANISACDLGRAEFTWQAKQLSMRGGRGRPRKLSSLGLESALLPAMSAGSSLLSCQLLSVASEFVLGLKA